MPDCGTVLAALSMVEDVELNIEVSILQLAALVFGVSSRQRMLHTRFWAGLDSQVALKSFSSICFFGQDAQDILNDASNLFLSSERV